MSNEEAKVNISTKFSKEWGNVHRRRGTKCNFRIFRSRKYWIYILWNSKSKYLAEQQEKLSAFYKNISPKEIKFLLDGKKQISRQELKELLTHNDIEGFDPIAEAFKVQRSLK